MCLTCKTSVCRFLSPPPCDGLWVEFHREPGGSADGVVGSVCWEVDRSLDVDVHMRAGFGNSDCFEQYQACVPDFQGGGE